MSKVALKIFYLFTDKKQHCCRNQRLGIHSCIGAAMIVVIFSGKQAIANWQSTPTRSRLMAQLPTLPSTTLPPTIFPTNQLPAVSVPPLQSTPTQTATPEITFQAPARLPASVPTFTSPVIEFGQPLPQTAQGSPRRTPERTIPTLEPSASD